MLQVQQVSVAGVAASCAGLHRPFETLSLACDFLALDRCWKMKEQVAASQDRQQLAHTIFVNAHIRGATRVMACMPGILPAFMSLMSSFTCSQSIGTSDGPKDGGAGHRSPYLLQVRSGSPYVGRNVVTKPFAKQTIYRLIYAPGVLLLGGDIYISM